MAEDSSLWTTGGAGDGAATITRADWSEILRVVGACMDNEGVAPAYLNNLVPSTTGANNARIGTGGALVDGKPYWNTAAVDVTIPSASGGGNTRIDRVVLRASWAAQTVRITRIAGTDAASPTAPAITQTAGTTYDIMLCQALVNTSGTVTITDERTFARPGTDSVNTAAISDQAITFAKIGNLAALSVMGRSANSSGVSNNIAATAASGEVLRESGSVLGFGTVATAGIANDAVDDTKVGNRVPQFYRRQGGSGTDWGVAGTTTQTPTSVRMQGGVIAVSGSGTITINFPVTFSNAPIVIVATQTANRAAYVSVPTSSGVDLFVTDLANAAAAATVSWLAIGPE